MAYHSPRSPSSAHRWRACSASIRETQDLPDVAGEEAIQGTVFHDIAATCVEFGIEPWGFVGSRVEIDDDYDEDGHLIDDRQGWREFTQEMAAKMLNGLDYINSVVAGEGVQLFVEKWVSTEPWIGKGEGGTSDAFMIDLLQRRLTIFDWKWGAGVPVDPEWNDQAIIYGLGVWHTFAQEIFEAEGITPSEIEVKVVIEQPRAPGGGGVWTTTMATLLAEGNAIREDAEATRDPDAPYNPGPKQCQFCTAARFNTCKARAQMVASLLDFDLEDEDMDAKVEAEDVLELPDRRAITPAARSYLLLNKKLIEKFIQQLHDEALEDAKKGLPVPGMKRVPGRAGAREWVDEEKAKTILIARLADDAYRKKLLSPAMVEEEVGRKSYREHWARHVAQSDPKPILVPESDPRAPMVSSVDLIDDLWAEEAEDRKTESLI